MLLPNGLTAQEIRILQEFRRVGRKSMSLADLRLVRHPVGGGDAPAWALAEKGYLAAEEGEVFSLTEQAEEFLSYDPKPMFEGSSPE
jgi:hypothetical protein